MLPVLLDLKFVKIYTFGVFLVLAFFWGCFLLWKLIRLTVYKEEDVFDGLFLSLAGGLFFGRLVYVILNFKDFGFDFFKFILINGYPGISLYGSLLGAFLVLLIYFSAKKIRFLDIIDYFIAPLFLSLALGKLGSFFSGVEIGKKTRFFLSVHYAGFDEYRHLPALYEGILFFLGAYIAHKLIFEVRKEKLTHGFVTAFFVWFFALVNFIFFRLTEEYSNFNQTTSKILLLTFSFYFLYYFRSLLLNFFVMIINLVKKYGQKAYQKVYRLSKGKTGKGLQ